jgi:Tol biopolymer transport system component
MTRTVLLMASVVLAFVAACMAALLVASVSQKAQAVSPGRNGKIAFSRTTGPPSFGNQIWTMERNGSGQTKITHTGSDYQPTWSPDGRKIAFTSARSGTPQVYTMDADGGNETRLTDFSAVDWEPAWFPSGERVVFSSDRDGDWNLYAITLTEDGRPLQSTQLTTSAANDRAPAVSPDGSKIAFFSDRDGDDEIYVMDADEPEGAANVPAQLTGARRREDIFSPPDWSPDGSKIAYAANARVPEGTRVAIFIMDADGTDKRRLTDREANELTPAWSPSGKSIVFSGNSGFRRSKLNMELWRVRADGSHPTRLTHSVPYEFAPDPQPRP